MCLPCCTRDREDDLGKRSSFLPNGESLVSTHIGTSEDVVSCTRNDFLKFSSLSSLINMTCHLFGEVAFYLMKMETTINVPLGLPL
jgi:hypothetical protein